MGNLKDCKIVGFRSGLPSGMLHSVGWLSTCVSGLRIGSIFKCKNTQEDGRWDRYLIPKRRCQTNVRCITSQKTTELKICVREVCVSCCTCAVTPFRSSDLVSICKGYASSHIAANWRWGLCDGVAQCGRWLSHWNEDISIIKSY